MVVRDRSTDGPVAPGATRIAPGTNRVCPHTLRLGGGLRYNKNGFEKRKTSRKTGRETASNARFLEMKDISPVGSRRCLSGCTAAGLINEGSRADRGAFARRFAAKLRYRVYCSIGTPSYI